MKPFYVISGRNGFNKYAPSGEWYLTSEDYFNTRVIETAARFDTVEEAAIKAIEVIKDRLGQIDVDPAKVKDICVIKVTFSEVYKQIIV